MTSAADKIGIYIHVPFCIRKCPYCDFYSCENRLHERELYVQAVCRNIQYYGNGGKVDTIYFGGGTPSLLTPLQIEEILSTIKSEFFIISPEITMEVNPATVTKEKLSGYRKAGVNRLSIGIQDLNDDALLDLGRLHTAADGIETVYNAADAGFENISCDLMIGTKDQTAERLDQTLEKLMSLPITHISAYMLKIEEGTPYYRQNMKVLIPNDDESAELYLRMVSFLSQKGFLQYEISNFAKKGFESRHNCRYWKLSYYLGIGPAAHSFFGNKRFYVPSDLELFLKDAHQSVLIEDETPALETERIMLGLRLSEGVPLSWLTKKGQIASERFVKCGFMEKFKDRVRFTPKGFLVSNAILCEILF